MLWQIYLPLHITALREISYVDCCIKWHLNAIKCFQLHAWTSFSCKNTRVSWIWNQENSTNFLLADKRYARFDDPSVVVYFCWSLNLHPLRELKKHIEDWLLLDTMKYLYPVIEPGNLSVVSIKYDLFKYEVAFF